MRCYPPTLDKGVYRRLYRLMFFRVFIMYSPIYTPPGLTFVSIDDDGISLWRDSDGSYWSTSVDDLRPLPCDLGPYGTGKTSAR